MMKNPSQGSFLEWGTRGAGKGGKARVQGKETSWRGSQSNNFLGDTLCHPYSHIYIFF